MGSAFTKALNMQVFEQKKKIENLARIKERKTLMR